MNPGSIVRCRNRDWILLPAESDDVWALRPLTGTEDDVVKVHKGLANLLGYDFSFERVVPASFPLPTPEDVSDAAGAYLLWQAARLTLREGATPFRSLGRISIRPRVYQFVPLLMALRLDPVRLFIADDVGVGKTIEALLVARELLDRGEIRRFCVLCPPYLCEQWAKELAEKFNLEPVVIRSGTVSQLERQVPAGKSVYEHFPVQVASIDFVKTSRNRHQFLQFCPELVIVDEVHGAAAAQGPSQQERHALLREVAKKQERHLILLTATPHSGIEEAFRSLLALLKPEFEHWDIAGLTEGQRTELARHFVQRTRADIQRHWETVAPFPQREPKDETYELSDRYRELFDRTYEFCSEIVRTGERLEERKRRVRYWGALALLRCVMSSPAAALAALVNRANGEWRIANGGEEAKGEQRVASSEWRAASGGEETNGERPMANGGEEEVEFSPYVFEPADERGDDETPTPPLEAAAGTLPDTDRRRLRELARLAEQLRGPAVDTKLRRAIDMVRGLVQEGFHPILWCRYVATAEYVAEHLRQHLPDKVQVVCVTGRVGDEERQAKIEEIDSDQPRVLVATDCLSEGINLQEKFTAVVHYDLPWNPNRLEQREGRVDRYGQPAKTVKAVRFFGRDNPVDGIVIEVLLDKAREIHRTLGTHVPVPEEGESVTQAVLEALFFRRRRGSPKQLLLDLGVPEVEELHRRWERDAERERINRTRFAQRALKPQEVQREVEATDAVLGDPAAVRDFVLTAAQRIGLPIAKDPKRANVYRVSINQHSLATVPEPIRLALPGHSPRATRYSPATWLISFESPTPEGAEYLGRNHRFVAALARFLLEEALTRHGNAAASRCGALRTRAVHELTTIFLLRVRYLIEQPHTRPLLSEEVLVLGTREIGRGAVCWLDDGEALRLLTQAAPDANIPLAEKRELVQRALKQIGEWRVASSEWKGESGEWRVASGECKGESGEWGVASSEWKGESGESRVASGEWKGESGEWRVASSEWKGESGEWRVASGECKGESGESRVASREWKGESGEWRVASGELSKDNGFLVGLRERIEERAHQLVESHKRIRQAVSLRVRGLEIKPQLPPDLLGILVLQPMVQR